MDSSVKIVNVDINSSKIEKAYVPIDNTPVPYEEAREALRNGCAGKNDGFKIRALQAVSACYAMQNSTNPCLSLFIVGWESSAYDPASKTSFMEEGLLDNLDRAVAVALHEMRHHVQEYHPKLIEKEASPLAREYLVGHFLTPSEIDANEDPIHFIKREGLPDGYAKVMDCRASVAERLIREGIFDCMLDEKEKARQTWDIEVIIKKKRHLCNGIDKWLERMATLAEKKNAEAISEFEVFLAALELNYGRTGSDKSVLPIETIAIGEMDEKVTYWLGKNVRNWIPGIRIALPGKNTESFFRGRSVVKCGENVFVHPKCFAELCARDRDIDFAHILKDKMVKPILSQGR